MLLQIALLVHQHLQPGQIGQAAELAQFPHQHSVEVDEDCKPGVGRPLTFSLQRLWRQLNLSQLFQVHQGKLE